MTATATQPLTVPPDDSHSPEEIRQWWIAFNSIKKWVVAETAYAIATKELVNRRTKKESVNT
jgi:adenylosuccinate lyase